MTQRRSSKSKLEYGDFQTPIEFCRRICAFLADQDVAPKSILEPTCGRGSFLVAALDAFPSLQAVRGIEIHRGYVDYAQQALSKWNGMVELEVTEGDFFSVRWEDTLSKLPDPLLVLGNPPWVTNSELSSLSSDNSPEKSNFQELSGITAITGASNFDISEWMLLQMLEWVKDREATIAMLCKTSVARKVLLHAWKREYPPVSVRLHLIQTQDIFDAAVDACLLIYDTRKKTDEKTYYVYRDLSTQTQLTHVGYRDNQLVANVEYYERWRHLQSRLQTTYQWRSGIKHDCAKVMELRRVENGYQNDFGDIYELEDRYVYPLLKSSDISESVPLKPRKWVLVTQRNVGDSTQTIKQYAPRTWDYLCAHSEYLDSRKSKIYQNRSQFAVFGVGDYSFANWKVAVSGMYKQLKFVVIGPVENKPVMLDDTCYFLACADENEAALLANMLNSNTAQEFFRAFIFWDSKRPITVQVLMKLDLFRLAYELDLGSEFFRSVQPYQSEGQTEGYEQLELWG
jgi:hypothetical protein